LVLADTKDSSIAEVSKKTGIRKKAVHVRAYRYRQLGIPLKDFPPVELPDWGVLAVYARSLLPAGAVSTGVRQVAATGGSSLNGGSADATMRIWTTHQISRKRNQGRLVTVNRHQNKRPWFSRM